MVYYLNGRLRLILNYGFSVPDKAVLIYNYEGEETDTHYYVFDVKNVDSSRFASYLDKTESVYLDNLYAIMDTEAIEEDYIINAEKDFTWCAYAFHKVIEDINPEEAEYWPLVVIYEQEKSRMTTYYDYVR